MAVLPSLTAQARRLRPAPRMLAAALAVPLVLGAALSFRVSDPPSAPTPAALRLEGDEVALAVPLVWLATPLGAARVEDRIDIVAVRRGDSASVYPLATNARVLSIDDRALVLALDPDDATQLALARANDLLIVPLVRPSR